MIRNDATYVDLQCEHRHGTLFPHSIFEYTHLVGHIVRRCEEAIHRSQNDMVCLSPVPYEGGNVRPVGEVEQDGAEDEDSDVGVCE